MGPAGLEIKIRATTSMTLTMTLSTRTAAAAAAITHQTRSAEEFGFKLALGFPGGIFKNQRDWMQKWLPTAMFSCSVSSGVLINIPRAGPTAFGQVIELFFATPRGDILGHTVDPRH